VFNTTINPERVFFRGFFVKKTNVSEKDLLFKLKKDVQKTYPTVM
jgi:hypothetical protein